MEQLHFITKLLDIKDPNIKILDIINKDTHKEIIAKLDYDAPSCPECGNQLKKYDFQKPFKCYHCSKMMVMAKGVNVGISTIYYWIHHGKLGLSKQDLLYPRKGKALKKQASTNFKPAGQSIEQRPEAINLRLENGHYEIDTVLLTRAKNYCLLVLTDRKSRHQIIRLIPNKSAEVVNQALKLILKQHKILSITADNGTEFNRLSNVFSEEHIYYAHPYASWERGTNENHNRLIRRWLPKGTKKMTPKEVAFIEKWINNYPKKCLDYKSPREDFWMANLNLKFSKMEIIFIKRFQ
ncbi:IS1239 transposase [Streptococcus pneumoniae]|uniref:IS30 family transposase n=1 Tax=Streptococcus pneumoniae TaxID=1313 RepID=UPI0005E62B30|nr:IS1239 transposase [Streptococcus pneumoniae]